MPHPFHIARRSHLLRVVCYWHGVMAHAAWALPDTRHPSPVSTNIALGAQVRSSHPVWEGMTGANLTDGAIWTLAHPADPTLGAAFYYEIDLAASFQLDHISLRQRSDDCDNHRFSRVLVQLCEKAPGAESTPHWTAMIRADGTWPEPAGVETVAAANGTGKFAGRHLRISSDSVVPLSPQLAEVEVYPTRTPSLTSILADGVPMPMNQAVAIPPRQKKLIITLNVPGEAGCREEVVHWRVKGFRDEWQASKSWALDISCPSAGSYLFEAQAAHSDRSFDATTLSFPFTVTPHFTETLGFRWVLSGTGLLIGSILMRRHNRRRIERLEAAAAVSEERTRIARDMHDDVGARLAQLAILHDVFAREFPQPEAARESLHQLSRIAREAVASLEEVLWTVEPQNDTLAATAEHIAQYTYEYLVPLKISCRIDAPPVWPSVEVRASVRQELNYVMKEALQNVAKHSHASEVLLTLRADPGHFSVQIEDNGRGMKEIPSRPGQDGLRNMKTRVDALAGTCTVTPRQPRGITVAIRIPLSP